MMKKIVQRRLYPVLAVILALSVVLGYHGSFAQAATFEEINQDSVFLKQPSGSGTCTLVAATMLVRRAAMMNGNSNWSSITTDVMTTAAWVTGVGLKWDFSCSGITVTHGNFSGSTSDLITLLSEHPEGIVVYKQKSDQNHAILVTDYTDGVFYCADPSGAVPSGRIPVASASIKIEDANYIWYVSSPVLYLTDSDGTIITHEVATSTPVVTATPKPTPTATPKATAKATATPKATAKATAKPKATEKTTSEDTKKEDTKKTSGSKKVTAPKKVSGVSAKNNKKKTITVTWNKVSSAKGYQMAYSTTGSFLGSAKSTLTGRKAQLVELTKGRTFFIKVRAYKLNGKTKVYGQYSKVEKVKVKK